MALFAHLKKLPNKIKTTLWLCYCHSHQTMHGHGFIFKYPAMEKKTNADKEMLSSLNNS